MLIDTHCHLNDERLIADAKSIAEAFISDNIAAAVNIGFDAESSAECAAQASAYPRLFCAVGVHPSAAQSATPQTLASIEALARTTKKCVAIGEIGLDYHYDAPSKDEQRAAFCAQIELADKIGLPIVVHVRDAYKDTLEILREYKNFINHSGIIHCYSGSAESARLFCEMGFYIAFGGAVTFKNNVTSPLAMRAVPPDRLLLETDCPYLAPVPYRGQTNYPKYIALVCRRAAEILGISEKETEDRTSANAVRLLPALAACLNSTIE